MFIFMVLALWLGIIISMYSVLPFPNLIMCLIYFLLITYFFSIAICDKGHYQLWVDLRYLFIADNCSCPSDTGHDSPYYVTSVIMYKVKFYWILIDFSGNCHSYCIHTILNIFSLHLIIWSFHWFIQSDFLWCLFSASYGRYIY